LLHHGSLVLRAPGATPNCGAVEEYCEPAGIRDALENELVTAIAEFLGLSPGSSAATEPELELAEELSAGRHRDPGHLRRR